MVGPINANYFVKIVLEENDEIAYEMEPTMHARKPNPNGCHACGYEMSTSISMEYYNIISGKVPHRQRRKPSFPLCIS